MSSEITGQTLVSMVLNSSPLGGDMPLNLEPRKTVLVGRNGAGKSIILDALMESRNLILSGVRGFETEEKGISCEFLDHSKGLFEYALMVSSLRVIEKTPTNDLVEFCRYKDANDFVWRTEANRTTGTAIDGEIRTTPGLGFVAAMKGEDGPWKMVRRLFSRITLIRAGVPRSSNRSPAWVVSKGEQHLDRTWGRGDHRIDRIAESLIDLYETDRSSFDEYRDLVRQLKLSSDVTIKSLSLHNSGVDVSESSLPEEITSVEFDGCNLGLLSDGTLRVAEILLEVVRRPSLLALEEPETSLHPGLLTRLLDVLESYSHAFQMLVTTQSQQVASWAESTEIRLVSREGKTTTVRSISEKESRRLQLFLDDDMTLGEFVYTGGIDD